MFNAIKYEALPRSDRAKAIIADLRSLADGLVSEKFGITKIECSSAIDGSTDFPRFDLKVSCFIRPDKD